MRLRMMRRERRLSRCLQDSIGVGKTCSVSGPTAQCDLDWVLQDGGASGSLEWWTLELEQFPMT